MYCETFISFSSYVGMHWIARLDTFLVLTRKVRKPDSSLLRIPQLSLLYTKKKKEKIPTPLLKGWNCPPNPLYFHNIMLGSNFSSREKACLKGVEENQVESVVGRRDGQDSASCKSITKWETSHMMFHVDEK